MIWVLGLGCGSDTPTDGKAGTTGDTGTAPPTTEARRVLADLVVGGLDFGPDAREASLAGTLYELPDVALEPTLGCVRHWEEPPPDVDFWTRLNDYAVPVLDGEEIVGGRAPWVDGAPVGVRASGADLPTIEEPALAALPTWDSAPARVTEGDGSVTVTWSPGADGAIGHLFVLGRASGDVLECWLDDDGEHVVSAADAAYLGDRATWRLLRNLTVVEEREGYVARAVVESGGVDF